MKKYRLISAILALFLLLGVFCCPAWAAEATEETAAEATTESQEAQSTQSTEPSAVQFRDYSALLTAEEPYEAECKSALLIEMDTNTVLYAKEADETRFPASLTKIMCCLVAIEKCASRGKSLDDLVTVPEAAFDDLDIDGSTAGIKAGDILSLRELLYCMMLESANESCNIVAIYLAGDVPTYVQWMNERAQSLGCTGTHYANTHGLHDPNHYTNAHDLALIAEAALENEEFCEIVNQPTYTVMAEHYSGNRNLITTNSLLLENSGYYYSRARGVKTGYTSAAGRCLITTATDGNLNLLVVILGAEDNDYTADGLRYRSFVEAKSLLQYGFENFDFAQVLSRLDMTAQVVVTGGDANSVVLYPSMDINCLLPEDYDKEQITTTWALDGGETKLAAPLEAGQKVGTITVSYLNVPIASTTLETLTGVKELSSVENMVADTSDFFKSTLPNFLNSHLWLLWLIPAVIVLLFVALIVRNSILRARRRAAIRRRKQQRAQQQRRAQQQVRAEQRDWP